MDKRVKYSYQQKLGIVKAIESGKESITSSSKKLGCSRSRIKQWLGHYRQAGAQGLKLRREIYNGDFRLKVIKVMINKGLSLIDTCSAFNIPNLGTVHRWLTIYKEHGANGLLKVKRGRKKTAMPRKKKQTTSDLSPEAQQLEKLRAEVEWLRAENDFLKKLDALIREKEAQTKPKKKRKSSGN
jgi:transposase